MSLLGQYLWLKSFTKSIVYILSVNIVPKCLGQKVKWLFLSIFKLCFVASFGIEHWIGLDKILLSRYVEGGNEKIVTNLELGNGLLKKKTYPFQSSPKW